MTTSPRQALLRRSFVVYLAIAATGAILALSSSSPALSAFGAGLAFPGGGLLAAAQQGAGPFSSLPIFLAGASLFALALLLWFATGNVLAPPLTWLALAVWAAVRAEGPIVAQVEALLPVSAIFVASLAYLRRPRPSPAQPAPAPTFPTAAKRPDRELNREDLERINLLLDRALQPVDAFQGFDRRDQFQTAATRYQINFMSYALSVVQAEHMPAFDGYLGEAQDRLAGKLMDRRIWRYWRLENLWGNLSADPDPIARNNIMFAGFLTAQLAFAGNASGRKLFDRQDALAFGPNERGATYSLPQVASHLAKGMRAARLGLMACEPNWVYPLCNAITASGIRAADAMFGTDWWNPLATRFATALDRDFTRPNGDLVPFASSLTGIAAPSVGGAVMQTFPCLFLNTILPELATHRWDHARMRLGPNLRRALWPVDVGNYAFSRASSYAASAAAAREMGDDEMADRLLALLEEECPTTFDSGVRHRSRASLWAHALEIMARSGSKNALRRIATGPITPGPRLSEAAYSEVMIAAATADGDTLRLVLRPRGAPTTTRLSIAGLRPDATYRIVGSATGPLRSDPTGAAAAEVLVNDRCEIRFLREGA